MLSNTQRTKNNVPKDTQINRKSPALRFLIIQRTHKPQAPTKHSHGATTKNQYPSSLIFFLF
jgi:hypothetical protein